MRKGFLALIAMMALLPLSAFSARPVRAQCSGGLIVNCPAAVNPQPGDLELGWQQGQNPHTRAATNAQILTGALQNPVVGKLTTQMSASGGAGLNLQVGSPPNACVAGDVWETAAGLFSCPAGTPIGPYGTGGSNLPVYTIATLPSVNSSQQGMFAFVTDCPNGNQVGAGATGCPYLVNNVGTWTALPSPSTLQITVGGQALYLGGTTTNQGNGSKIALASGSFTNGNCRETDANGNEVDSGAPCGGGAAGVGTIASSPVNAVGFYSTNPTGTTITGMAVINNAVVATNSSGVPSEVTTLPANLIIQSPTISAPTLTGTASISNATLTGKLITATSGTGAAGLNVPPGVAPSSPVNGDIWETSSGILGRVNGATQGPFVGNIVTSSPLTGGATGPTVTVSCATCATTTNGGAITATAPMTISAGGLIALGLQPAPITWIADSSTTVHNDTYNLIEKWLWTSSGTISSFVYHTGGTSTPSFVASLQIAGTPVTGCNTITVSSGSDTTATCTAANTITNGQALSLVITGTNGIPSSAVVQVNMLKPAS